jgi:DNA-binding transcriptional ArsR family regulator/YHS domain-containing protein
MYGEIFELQAEMCKALAHPKRLEIVHLLRDQSMFVSDIYEMLDLPQANISQHLMILREAGIVASTRNGKQIEYSLSHPQIILANDMLREVLIDQHQDSAKSDHWNLPMKDLVPLVHDPVCLMRLSPKTAGWSATHNEKHFYFCASGCLKKFQETPEAYV